MDGGACLKVRVQPKASRDALAGEREGALVVRLQAPPVDGAANQSLVRFLARVLGVPSSWVTIVVGKGGRDKRVRVLGLRAAELLQRLEGEGK